MTRGPFLLVIAAALVAVTALVGSLVVSGGEAQAQSSVPAAPTGLSASAVSHDAVSLAWDDPADAAITGYQVLRRSRDGDAYRDGRGAWEFVAVVADTASSATSYTDTSVTARTRYVYRVKAINPAGLGARSSYANVETPDAPAAQTAPGAPTGLRASSVSYDAVSLAWDDAGDTTIGGYEVLRRSRDGDAYGDGRGAAEFVAVVADTASPATSYTDTTVTAHTRYVYRVVAANAAGTSPRSSYLNVETPPAPENPEPEPETTETGTETTDTTEPPAPVATAVLVTEPPEDEPQTAQQQTSADQTLTTTIWTATMTVGVTDTTAANGFRIVERGYASSALRESPYGGLDDDTFDYNGHTYTVDRLATARTTAPSNAVIQDNFRLTAGESGDRRLGADLVLYVGDQPFHLDDAGPHLSTHELTGDRLFISYFWADLPVLVDGESVAVRLVEELPPIPAPETIWSTTMTTGAVESRPRPSDIHRDIGYTILGDPSDHFGSLADNTFDYDGNTYTVHQISQATKVFVSDAAEVFYGERLFHVTVDDHGNDLSDLVLYIGDYWLYPFADAATTTVGVLGTGSVRALVFDLIPLLGGSQLDPVRSGQRVAVRIDRLDREFRGPDGYPVSARLAVGDDWVDQTYPNVCGGLDRFTCRLPDADSQWFVVRLEDNRRYVVEVDTEANNHRPRLNHVAPTWATDSRIQSSGDRVYVSPPRQGHDGYSYTGVTGMLTVETFAGARVWRGGDYLVRVSHTGYSVNDPDYRIRIREQ